ncbi:MAG: hypothetical protein GY937_13585 [bacterium]|nr:hypothetical protein [bacterium]
MSALARNRHLLVLCALLVLGVGAWLVSNGLAAAPEKDEVHFLETTLAFFVGPLPPSVESLRSYPEVITPFAFVVWGQLHHLFGDGLFAGRLLNLFVALGLLGAIALPRTSEDPTVPLRAALGLALFPYFMALAVHLYTDIPGAALVVLGLHLHLRSRWVGAAVVFAIAIATRQYMVFVPAAVAAWECLRFLKGDARWVEIAGPLVACTTLLAWIAFWGGLAPERGLDRWIAPYPAPMLEPLAFILEYGLYSLVGIGVYFTLPEAILFRQIPPRAWLAQRSLLIVAAVMAAAFIADPPFLPPNHPGGPFGRAARWLLPGEVGGLLRMVVFYAMAMLGAMRFLPRTGLSFWLVALAVTMSMKSQIPWEKYLLPCLACLWYLRSRPGQPGGATPAWEMPTTIAAGGEEN